MSKLGKSPSLLARLTGSASLIAAAMAANATAQEAPTEPIAAEAAEEDEEARLGTVKVTARFREETAQDIGASISALGNAEITDGGIVDFEDIARSVPGVAILDNGSNRNDITIRGVANATSASGRGSTAPLVSIYVDDIAIASSGAGTQRDINLFDFNRVEVLRGPQPTLFGEGSVGGVVRYFSQDPTLDGDKRVDGLFNSEVSFTEDGGTNYRVEGAAGFTLIPDVLGVRVVGSYREDGGFVDNTGLMQEDINTLESVTGRAVVLFEPTPNLTFRGSATFTNDDIGDFNEVDGSLINGSIDGDNLVAPALNLFDGLQEDDIELYSGKIAWDAGPMQIESITGYYTRDRSETVFDAALTLGLPAAFQAFPSPLPPLNAAIANAPNLISYDPTSLRVFASETEQFSQEFRFISQFDGPLNFTSGLFYQDVEGNTAATTEGPGYVDITIPATTVVTSGIFETESEELSGFVEFTYDVSDRLRLIGGARYVEETITTTVVESGAINLFAPVTATGDDLVLSILTGVGYTFGDPVFFTIPDDVADLIATGVPTTTEFELNEVLPRVGFEYDISEDILIYGNAAKGLRNGGQNSVLAARGQGAPGTPEFLATLNYSEDSAITTELGLKSTLLDGDWIFNIGVFHTDYEDAQITTGTPVISIANAPDQRILGLEIDTNYRFTDNVTGFFSGAYTDAEFTGSAALLPVSDAMGVQIVGFEDVAEGNTPPGVPEFSFATGFDVNYGTNWDGVDFVGRVDFQYVGERNATSQNFPSTELGSLELLNLRAGLENDRISLVAFATNLTNDLELTSTTAGPGASFVNGVLDASLGTATFVNRPRTMGVNLRVKF